jgi:hypothetical protein
MTEEEENELEQEKRNLEYLLALHSRERLIKDKLKFEEHINAILDRIAEIERELKK